LSWEIACAGSKTWQPVLVSNRFYMQVEFDIRDAMISRVTNMVPNEFGFGIYYTTKSDGVLSMFCA